MVVSCFFNQKTTTSLGTICFQTYFSALRIQLLSPGNCDSCRDGKQIKIFIIEGNVIMVNSLRNITRYDLCILMYTVIHIMHSFGQLKCVRHWGRTSYLNQKATIIGVTSTRSHATDIKWYFTI